MSPRRSSSRKAQKLLTIVYLSVVLPISLGALLLFTMGESITVGEVPLSIIISFLQDETARDAYFAKDGVKLHDRLDEMGIEEKMKDHYRSEIPNPVELDQYIHQVLYERTGYVGKAYKVNSQGVLVLKNPEVPLKPEN